MIGHSKDLSESGICLVGEQGLPEGKMLDLRFTLPGTEGIIQAFGKVMWSRKASVYLHEAGVTFWQIADNARQALVQFLSQNMSDEGN